MVRAGGEWGRREQGCYDTSIIIIVKYLDSLSSFNIIYYTILQVCI